LLVTSSALLTEIELQPERRMTLETMRVLVLYGLLCCTNMYEYGVRQPHRIAVVYARIGKPEHYPGCLPCDYLTESLRDFLFTTPDALRVLSKTVSYDGTMWLLRAAQALRGFALPRSVIAALELPTLDLENRNDVDQRAALVSVLRSTIFRLPMAGAEFSEIDSEAQPLREQSCFETPRLAAHNTESVQTFFNQCTAHKFAIDHDDLVRTIDVLAFDRRYLTEPDSACAVGDDDNRPRLLERAARDGFVHIHRRTFGRIDRHHDARMPVRNNATRVSLPQTDNAWYTAQVYCEPRLQLAAGYFGLLPQHIPDTRAVAADFNIDASDYAIDQTYATTMPYDGSGGGGRPKRLRTLQSYV